MRVPVDTSALRFTVAGAPEPLQRHEHVLDSAREPRRSGDDAEPWRVPLRVTGAGPEQVVHVTRGGRAAA